MSRGLGDVYKRQGLPSISNVGSGKLIPSSLMHCAKSKTPSSKVTSSNIVVETVFSSIETTPFVSSSPIVHAFRARTIVKSATFLLPLLVEFLTLLLPDKLQILLQLIMLKILLLKFAIQVLRIQYLCS